MPMMVSITQQMNLYPMPENKGMPAMPCAMPMVKGLSMAPEKPMCAATYTMQTPTMES